MTTNQKSIAILLNCASTDIPYEYEDKAIALTSRFIKMYSLTGLFDLDYSIIYNHICFHIKQQIESNSLFSPKTFSEFIDEKCLFYGYETIQKLVRIYRQNPNDTLPFAIAFFAKKIKSVKDKMLYCTKGLQPDEIDEVLVIATNKLLTNCNPEALFSFETMDLELKAALAELAGELFPVKLPRNDLVSYFAFCNYIEKYELTVSNIKIFLEELELSVEEAMRSTDLNFSIEKYDRENHRKFTLKKAMYYYQVYTLFHDGVSEIETYNKEQDRFYDISEGIIDTNYSEAELRILESQILSDDNEQRIFRHFVETGSASFTNKELADDFHYTRYALHRLQSHIGRCLSDDKPQKTKDDKKKFGTIK